MWTHFIFYNIGLCYSAIIMYLNHITWTLAAMYWHQQSIWIVFLRIRTQIWTFLINCTLFKLERDSEHPPSSFALSIFTQTVQRNILKRLQDKLFIFFCEMFLEYLNYSKSQGSVKYEHFAFFLKSLFCLLWRRPAKQSKVFLLIKIKLCRNEHTMTLRETCIYIYWLFLRFLIFELTSKTVWNPHYVVFSDL